MTRMAVSVPEAAEMIGVGRATMYNLIRDKKVAARKSGKRTLVLIEELKRYVDSLPSSLAEEAA